MPELIAAVVLFLFAGYMFFSIRQIRELKKKNEVLTQLGDRAGEALLAAQKADAQTEEFYRNMSHDIRTSINAVIGTAGLIQRDANDTGRVRDRARKIISSSHQLLGLVNSALDIARMESGQMMLEISQASFSELLEDVAASVKPQFDERNHTLKIDKRNVKCDNVFCDANRLKQILINILSNAAKYTENGGEISFTVSETPTKQENAVHLQFTVRDNGIGMAEGYIERIFEPFTREENTLTNKLAGAGLGMAITKRLVEMMGGTIAVESRRGSGSTFTVELELNTNYTGASPRTAFGTGSLLPELGNDWESGKVVKSVLNGMHFLVAEDNELNAEILQEQLLMHGASGDFAENGQRAVEKFEGTEPDEYDMILMDIQMPIMNGYEATRCIRVGKHSRAKTVPIIAMTANVFLEDIQSAREAGMNGHVAKPTDIRQLERVVETALEELHK